MSFTIDIGKSTSPVNALTKNFTSVISLSGTLKNETEIVNPTIIIETNSADIFKCNYMQISEFKRSYFITSIKSIRNKIFEIEAHCDVLSSFAGEIKSNKAIILRQENDFNLLLNDDVFKCKQNSRIYYKKFPSQLGQYSYILVTAGGS
mgnify:CR=1 FL=1